MTGQVNSEMVSRHMYYNRTEYETSIHAIHSLHPTYHQKYMPYQMPSISTLMIYFLEI